MAGENDAVLGEIQREVKAFGDNVKGLKDSVERDLAAVRKLAEDTKGAIGPEVKAQIDALTTSVTEKHAALETNMKGFSTQLTDVEKKLTRRSLGGGVDPRDTDIKSAREFQRHSLAIRNELKVSSDLSDEKIDIEGFKAYSGTFGSYMRKGEQLISNDEMKSMSVGSDPDGGYLVTPQISSRMLSVIYESSPMRELATVETISTDAIEYPVDDGEAGAGWVGETESRSETTTPQVGVQRIPVHEMYAEPRATQKLLEDASIDVEAWLGRKIGDKFGRMEATAFVSGNGIKKPRGFLAYANGTTRGTIEQIVSGNATLITADGLINLILSMKEPYTPGATFLVRRATVGSIMLLKDTTNQYIWRPGLEAGKPSTLLGHPVREAADMPAVGAGALAVAFGNFRVGYTIVDRIGISTLRDPFTAKPFVKFYTRKRVGGDVTNFEAIKLMVISA